MGAYGNAHGINDEMDARIGGAGPAYTNPDRERAVLSRGDTQRQNTLGDCADHINQLNGMLDNVLEQIRIVTDRIGAPFPPSGVQPATKDGGNGPIDYIRREQGFALDKVAEIGNFVAAIGSRI